MKRSLSLTADEEVEVEAKAPRIAREAEEDSLASPAETLTLYEPPAALATMLPEIWTAVFTLGDLRAWLGFMGTSKWCYNLFWDLASHLEICYSLSPKKAPPAATLALQVAPAPPAPPSEATPPSEETKMNVVMSDAPPLPPASPRKEAIMRTNVYNLRSLKLDSKDLVEEEYAAVATRVNLRSLSLAWRNTVPQKLVKEHLKPLTSLRYLALKGQQVHSLMATLPALSNLRSLYIHEYNMVNCDFLCLSALPLLEELEVEVPLTRELDEMRSLSQLTALSISRSHAQTASMLQVLQCVVQLPQLKKVSLKENSAIQAIPIEYTQGFTDLTRLEVVELKGFVFTSDSWRPIAALPALVSLRLESCHAVSPAFLEALSKSKRLNYLKLKACSGCAEADIDKLRQVRKSMTVVMSLIN